MSPAVIHTSGDMALLPFPCCLRQGTSQAPLWMLLFDCTWYTGKSEDWYGGKDGVVVAYIHDTLRHLLWVLRCLKISSVCQPRCSASSKIPAVSSRIAFDVSFSSTCAAVPGPQVQSVSHPVRSIGVRPPYAKVGTCEDVH